MDYDLKVYGMLGFDTRHIETIDKVYGSVVDKDFDLERQPKKIKDIIKRLGELPPSMRPKFIFESSVATPARRLKVFASGVFGRGNKSARN